MRVPFFRGLARWTEKPCPGKVFILLTRQKSNPIFVGRPFFVVGHRPNSFLDYLLLVALADKPRLPTLPWSLSLPVVLFWGFGSLFNGQKETMTMMKEECLRGGEGRRKRGKKCKRTMDTRQKWTKK